MQFNRQTGDFLIYLTGSLVVALVAIIKLPVFTSHFTPAEFGVFTLVSITYTYLSITLYGWISSCLYRYYHEFTDKGEELSLIHISEPTRRTPISYAVF